MTSHRLTEDERRSYDEDGYLVRPRVFGGDDLRELRHASERVVADLVAHSSGRSLDMGSYVFEIEKARHTVIKWEADARDTVLGVEPVAHLHPAIEKYAHDPRLTEPMRDAIAADEVCLYTEKLNVKRARVGGPVVLHQDYPYWADVADDATRIATALVFLDDANRTNGGLEVAPGSHRLGLQPGKATDDPHDFGRFETDPECFDTDGLVSLDVAAGGVVFLGPFLVHRSEPNPSDADRRALLFSYQPRGMRHSREYIRLGP